MKVCFEHSIFSTGVYLTLPDITLGYSLTDMREVAKYGLVFKYLQGTRTFSLAPVKPLLLLVCACLSEFIKVYCVFPCLDVYRQVRADETVLDPWAQTSTPLQTDSTVQHNPMAGKTNR